jgi:WD40 repeat protein
VFIKDYFVVCECVFRQWNIMDDKSSAERVLPHPGFVYCCKYHPRLDSIVVTGCYDQALRVWDLSHEEEAGQVLASVGIWFEYELGSSFDYKLGSLRNTNVVFSDEESQGYVVNLLARDVSASEPKWPRCNCTM